MGPWQIDVGPLENYFSDPWFVAVMVVVAALLGRASYTDLFRGRIIENKVNLAIFLIGLITAIIVYPLSHFLVFLAIAAFLLFLVLIGATAEGDFKLYLALSLFLGWASVYMIFISWILIIIYALPIAIKTAKKNRDLKEKPKFGHRLGSAPGGPGIAGGFLLTFLVFAGPVLFGVMFFVSSLSFVLNYLISSQKDHLKEMTS